MRHTVESRVLCSRSWGGGLSGVAFDQASQSHEAHHQRQVVSQH